MKYKQRKSQAEAKFIRGLFRTLEEMVIEAEVEWRGMKIRGERGEKEDRRGGTGRQ